MGTLSQMLPVIMDGLTARNRREQYRSNPGLWVKEYLGLQVWSKQREEMESVRDHRRSVVIAAHGTGKTYSAALTAAWWIDSYIDDEPFVASTAPTFEQTNLLWDNLRDIHALATRRYEEYKRRLENGIPLGEYAACDHPLPGHVRGDNKWVTDNGRIIGEGRKPADSSAETAFQGRHAKRLLAIGDESVGIIKEFIDALGNIATGELNRQLLLCNPTDPSSETAKIWSRALVDGSWNTIQVSLYDSPTITHEEGFDLSRAKGLSGMDYIEEKKLDWGEDDPRFISRVLGQWAYDAANTVFTDVDIAAAINTCVLPDPEARPQQGWDIARFGADFTIGYQAVRGWVWETDDETGKPVRKTDTMGWHIRKLKRWGKAPLTGSDPENLGSAERIHDIAKGEGARIVAVDASGMGGGVIDGLNDIARREHGRPYEVLEVFGGAAPSDRREYINMRAEQYFEAKKNMFAGRIDLDPKDELLLDELRGIVYEYDSKGSKKIESKDDMKRRGVKSPDHADAFWYAAMDASALLDDPLAGAKRGDMVYHDPFELLNLHRNGDGMPFSAEGAFAVPA